MFPFQGLHPGQFIIADHFFILCGQVGCLFIKMVDGAAFFIKYCFRVAASEPVADLVRLKIRFFLRDVPRGGAKWSRRYLA